MQGTRSLPVLMYHYVSDQENSIAVSRKLFEEQCCTLAEAGWKGISLEEAEHFFLTKQALPPKSFLITFDDGYLDNYMYAMPILQKYGHKGTMFAVSNRIDDSETLRATPEELFSGKVALMPELDNPTHINELGYTERRDIFCNKAEVRAMEQSGVMQVASHTFGHFGVFSGSEYTHFHSPQGKRQRTFYATAEPWLWGIPELRVVPGLINRAFLLSEELKEKILSLVPQTLREADAFFKSGGESKLTELVSSVNGNIGRFETSEEEKKRREKEICGGKEQLEEILGHSLKTLCWPWGAWNEASRSIAKDAGFSVLLTTKVGVNYPGQHDAIHRFKAKAKSGTWLLNRVRMYSHPFIGSLYTKIRI